jgi:hypothetical protein
VVHRHFVAVSFRQITSLDHQFFSSPSAGASAPWMGIQLSKAGLLR